MDYDGYDLAVNRDESLSLWCQRCGDELAEWQYGSTDLVSVIVAADRHTQDGHHDDC